MPLILYFEVSIRNRDLDAFLRSKLNPQWHIGKLRVEIASFANEVSWRFCKFSLQIVPVGTCLLLEVVGTVSATHGSLTTWRGPTG